MLSPVSSLPITTATAPLARDTPVATQTLAAATAAVDAAVALSIAANSEVAGKLNMLLIGARERMIDSLFAVVDAVSQSLNMQQQEGETNVDFAARLATAISNLDPKQAAAIQQQVNAQVQSAPLALVARALQNPAGSEAAQVVAYLEVVRYKEKDLATKAVVASYGQNGADEPAPAKAPVVPAPLQSEAVRQDAAAAQVSRPFTSQTVAPTISVPVSLTEGPTVTIPTSPQAASSEAQTAETTAAPAAGLPAQADPVPESLAKSAPAAMAPVVSTAVSVPSSPLPTPSANQPAAAAPALEEHAQQAEPAALALAVPTNQVAAAPLASPSSADASISVPQAPQPNEATAAPSVSPLPAANGEPAAGTQGGPVASGTPLPGEDVPGQIPKDMQAALKVVVAQLANATGVELLQTMAEVAPVADKVVAQALVADMLDSAEIGTLPSPEDDAALPRLSLPQASSQPAQPAAVAANPAEQLASVATLNRLLGDTVPVVLAAAQPLPLQAQLPLGVPFAVGQYLPADDVADENEALRIDRVDAVGDEEEERSSGRQHRSTGDDAADEQGEPGGAHPETLASEDADVRPLALPRPAPVEPVREPAFNLYQRMGGWD